MKLWYRQQDGQTSVCESIIFTSIFKQNILKL